MCVANWALLTPLDNLAAVPFSLDHGEAGAVEDLCADGLLERLAHELRAGVGVLEISHASSAPILHHVAHESVETEEMLSEIDRAGMVDEGARCWIACRRCRSSHLANGTCHTTSDAPFTWKCKPV